MTLLQVALPVAVQQVFDYLPLTDESSAPPPPGARVRVPLGRRQLVGVVVKHLGSAAATARRYKRIAAIIDETALIPPPLLALCQWCARYYQHPLGQVIATALPVRLRGEAPADYNPPVACVVTQTGHAALGTLPARNVAQRALLEQLATAPTTRAQLPASARGALKAALEHGWVVESALQTQDPSAAPSSQPTLTPEQARAWAALQKLPPGFSATLLDGVTGSGKTELYLRLAQQVVASDRQVLVLAPEIGLTPQLAARFSQRFGQRVACYHSGMGAAARAQTWLGARAGDVDIVVGTRSAVFVPLARPGLVIVDEEHDTSYKQQEGLRYSGRDVALLRAQRMQVPVILGSATPSLETLHNAARGRYRHLQLTQRVNARPAPQITLIDVRRQTLEAGLSEALLASAHRHLERGGQILFFLNRRGFSPVLMCHDCGWMAPCPHCDARLTLHRRMQRLLCHHCGHFQAPPTTCPSCGHSPLAGIGEGTERVEEALRRHFPGERVERIDSDRARTASSLDKLFDEVRSGAIRILVGTQILAKGHDFPGLTLAGILDADAALYGTDFRAPEHLAQLVTQVSGRVGRGRQPGQVIMQTHLPDNPQLLQLATQGYAAVARDQLATRHANALPPYTHLALLRAAAPTMDTALAFLKRASQALGKADGIERLGPIAAPMERRAGRYHAQLLLRAGARRHLQTYLARRLPQVRKLRSSKALRWSVDVDPADLY